MITVCCTKKLAELLPPPILSIPTPTDSLSRWCANITTIQRKHVLVAVCADTRFGFVLWGLKKPDFAKLPSLIKSGIETTLASYGIRKEIIDDYVAGDVIMSVGMDRGEVASLNRTTMNLSQMQFKERPKGPIPTRIAHLLNGIPANVTHKLSDSYIPRDKMLDALEMRYGMKPICRKAFMLEASLDLERYVARRTLIVPASFSFASLHGILQGAFGWGDYHLYAFVVDGKRLVCPQDEMEDGLPAGEVLLEDILRKDMIFSYVYDFGDDWQVGIHVAGVYDAYDKTGPICTQCEGAAPPEDVGGIDGYLNFLDAYMNPKHPEHKEVREWIGYRWTPEPDIRMIRLRIDRWKNG